MPRAFPARLMKKQRQNVKRSCLKAVGLNLSCCKLKRCHLIQRNYTGLLQEGIGLENFKCDRSRTTLGKFLIFCGKGRTKPLSAVASVK